MKRREGREREGVGGERGRKERGGVRDEAERREGEGGGWGEKGEGKREEE